MLVEEELDSLLRTIERKRKVLERLAKKVGVCSKSVLEASQELDGLIFAFQKGSLNQSCGSEGGNPAMKNQANSPGGRAFFL